MHKMSFVDLATLTLHRRHELESRTHVFEEKCDRAINDIKNLKLKAKGFVSQLNCEPSELKDRFLNVMQRLDEYIYLITDFNLAMAQTTDTDSAENTPVQDTPNLPPSLSPFNLMDALSEPLAAACRVPTSCPPPSCPPPSCPPASCPPASCPPPGFGPIPPHNPIQQQRLIVFSSSSSAESVPRKSEKEIQCHIEDDVDNEEPAQPAAVSSPPAQYSHKECCITAAQTMLEIDHEYPATIISANSYSFWVITEDPAKVADFMSEMTEYYMKNKKKISASELEDMTYCAYCEDGVYYRAMFLQKPEGELKTVNVYVIDTGEEREAPIESVQPLAKQFCDLPPYARLCHLAGLDFVENLNNKTLMEQQDAFMNKFKGTQCTILVDDNSSESLGVFVWLSSLNTTLNQLMLDRGLAVPTDKPSQAFQERIENLEPKHSPANPSISHGPPPETSEDEWSITQCPEYEDPVVAVTGYHNRDEADICKHYKGGPDKTCFKGTRCTKKHILHHPDGWTQDKMEVIGKCPSVQLPAPGTWLKVLVTAICHFDRLFVQIIQEPEEEEVVPEFGVVLPPMTLASLQRDMNSLATRQAYKPLTIAPALGEIVAALYPPDNCWYRARVLTVTRLDQSVEVMYIDFGTVLWVKEDLLRRLEARFAALPQQGVQCALAGVRAAHCAQAVQSGQWARAKRELAALAQDRRLDAHVIAREYDEIVIELFTYDDPEDPTRGQSVAEQLAKRGLVDLVEYEVVNDDVTQRLVVP